MYDNFAARQQAELEDAQARRLTPPGVPRDFWPQPRENALTMPRQTAKAAQREEKAYAEKN